MRTVHNCAACIAATPLSPNFASRFIRATVWKAGSTGLANTDNNNKQRCSKTQPGPAAAPQRESAGLELTGMRALMSRTIVRLAAKRQRQCSTPASFCDPFATSSWPREPHIHRSREGDGIGEAASHAHTRSRCQRANAQGLSQVGTPPPP
jgi:hypothetical protein